MASKAATGPRAIVWIPPSSVRAVTAPPQVIGTPPRTRTAPPIDGQREQDEERGRNGVAKEVADFDAAGQAAGQGGQRGQAGRGREELENHQAVDLGRRAQHGFAGIMLQVGVGDEGRGDMEDEMEGQPAFVVGIPGQDGLQGQDQRRPGRRERR